MKTSGFASAYLLSAMLFVSLTTAPSLSAKATAVASDKSQSKLSAVSDINPQPIVTNNYDGSKSLEDLTSRIARLGAYKFDGLLSTTIKESKVKEDSGAFYYMPQSCLRVEVKGKGYKSGSVLVKQKNGVIRAQGGPALLGMKMNLEADSNMLRLANGLNIIDCDYLSLLKWLKAQISSGQKIYASEAPLAVGAAGERFLVIETRDAGPPLADVVAHRILIDPQLQVPVQWEIFRDGKFFSSVYFKNFQLCPSMDESLFKL